MNKKLIRSLIIAAVGLVLLAFLLPSDCRNAYLHPEKDVDSTGAQPTAAPPAAETPTR